MRDDIIEGRRAKLQVLRDFGMNPYPEKTKRMQNIEDVQESFKKFFENESEVTIAGRIRSLRVMGKIAFAHIEDLSGKMQIFFEEKTLGETFRLFSKSVDIGDFIEVSGKVFLTKKEEKTIKGTSWSMLSKTIRPIPSEHFGIKDTEELLRKRYLDLLVHPETKDIFFRKNIFWKTVRDFLSKEGFLEVQTPVLENVPGGADAEPFITRHNAMDRDFYLRISLELALKRLLVGGYEKVFEIGRLFRNEGVDREHLQEYDDVEFYWAYGDLEKGMQLSEELFRCIARNILSGYTHTFEGAEIDWERPFARVDYFQAFLQETGIDLSGEVTVEMLKKKADELGILYDPMYGKGRMIDTLYKKTVRQKLIQPCFLVGHPIEVSPLAKSDPENPRKVLRMQIVAGKSELCNAFSELNDPIEQRMRFEEQMKLRENGDKEAQMIDEDFLEALEYGMPPAFGFGMSERFFALLMNRSVRETVLFPPMRKEE
ncbi:MAG: lysine--tRNA ligase [Candidatus Moraniibacteriota bacterium]|nr:MAG: lysine--tRNA ligase [Candidatus Moranbacteria bacterium]